MRKFLTIGLNNISGKNRTRKKFFDSVFSYMKLGGSSLTCCPVFVVLYLKLLENIDQMSNKHIFLFLLQAS